ncbi:E3 ubiquitin-protein ligase UPL6 [Porphyridium purpureum]|uniref:HECT-type E3 ubiquitin transferase n=1 Tax=Porphyridium purpureum TaxID=35688 RepID=A0A5J4Z9K7_PORPP|nr:E3 ubiquitin-protein ligase UPL6 [Porphyridium purpureum]|eukprot:POR0712..scf295_1
MSFNFFDGVSQSRRPVTMRGSSSKPEDKQRLLEVAREERQRRARMRAEETALRTLQRVARRAAGGERACELQRRQIDHVVASAPATQFLHHWNTLCARLGFLFEMCPSRSSSCDSEWTDGSSQRAMVRMSAPGTACTDCFASVCALSETEVAPASNGQSRAISWDDPDELRIDRICKRLHECEQQGILSTHRDALFKYSVPSGVLLRLLCAILERTLPHLRRQGAVTEATASRNAHHLFIYLTCFRIVHAMRIAQANRSTELMGDTLRLFVLVRRVVIESAGVHESLRNNIGESLFSVLRAECALQSNAGRDDVAYKCFLCISEVYSIPGLLEDDGFVAVAQCADRVFVRHLIQNCVTFVTGHTSATDKAELGIATLKSDPMRVFFMLQNVLDVVCSRNSLDEMPVTQFIALVSVLLHLLPRHLLVGAGGDEDESDGDSGAVDRMQTVPLVMSDRRQYEKQLSNAQGQTGKSMAALQNVLDISGLVARLKPLLAEDVVMQLIDSALGDTHDASRIDLVLEDDAESSKVGLAGVSSCLLLVAEFSPDAEVPLLNTLAFSKSRATGVPLLRSLWYACSSPAETSQKADSNSNISRVLGGQDNAHAQLQLPVFKLFVKAYLHNLFVINSKDMLFGAAAPFSKAEVCAIAIALKQLVFEIVWNIGSGGGAASTSPFHGDGSVRDLACKLISRLHDCDLLHRFSSNDGAFWIAGKGLLTSNGFAEDCLLAGRGGFHVPATFHQDNNIVSHALRKGVGAFGSQTPRVLAAATFLKRVPFFIPFDLRAKIFSQLVTEEREEQSAEFFASSGIWVTIRREYLFEDAFASMNSLRERLRKRVRIKFVDVHGLEEAGIDGGGVFKEFLHEFMANAFSPSMYGLFKETPSGRLYPNPSSALISPHTHLEQFEFLGRMLAKALFDGVLVKLPFATFFLNKILGKHSHFEDLESLDPDLFKNLLYLKECDAALVPELGLNFTIVENEFDECKEVELCADGVNRSVDANNRVEYIHRVAHYKLNVQMRLQTAAFLRGFADVMRLEWIQIFNANELQLLISGKEGQIDLLDLRRHTHYSGGYTEDSAVIQYFWRVMAELSAEQQSNLLQFVTSSPRAPLLGFRFLNPGFCIHRAEGEDRLPTASTCMNLLKLPEYPTPQQLQEKLLYALSSHAGFDLS